MRFKTLAVAAATFGLLGGVALADDQPQPAQGTQQQNVERRVEERTKIETETRTTPVPAPAPGAESGSEKTLPSPSGADGGSNQLNSGSPETDKAGQGDQGGLNQGSPGGATGGGAGTSGDSDYKANDTQGSGDVPKGKVDLGAGPKVMGPGAGQSDVGKLGEVGHVGDAQVRQVQQKLSDQGLYRGTVDGKMGPKTRAAIRDFQKSQSLKADGQLNQETLGAMGVVGSDTPAAPNQDQDLNRGSQPQE